MKDTEVPSRPVTPAEPISESIHLLIFELGGQQYAVAATQVEAIVNSSALDIVRWNSADPSQVHDTDIASVAASADKSPARRIPVRSLGQWLGLGAHEEGSLEKSGFVDHAAHSSSGSVGRAEQLATRVLLTRVGGSLRGVEVGQPSDIITLPLENIHPMPILIKRMLDRHHTGYAEPDPSQPESGNSEGLEPPLGSPLSAVPGPHPRPSPLWGIGRRAETLYLLVDLTAPWDAAAPR